MKLLILLLLVVWTVEGTKKYSNRKNFKKTDPGPWVEQTNGEIWPKPQVQAQQDGTFFTLDVENFSFELDKYSSVCDIINKAVKRYFPRFFPSVKSTDPFPVIDREQRNDINWAKKFGEGLISKLEIVMNNQRGCEKYPHDQMDEHYEIKIDTEDERGKAKIISFSVWGILRGLESFSQLIYTKDQENGLYFINRTQIMDFPRFSFRGILLDSSRHFLSMKVLIQNLDLMEMNKMNVFHWHLVDDPAFPYDSTSFPDLSKKGAYTDKHIYSQADIAEIIEEARIRGIRVIPEFDTPGHTQSWELGHPGLLTVCNGTQLSTYGPMNPIEPTVYDFLSTFFSEIYNVFPDKYLHIGGDEVDVSCWESNEQIKEYMHKNNLTDYKALESLFIQQLFGILDTFPINKTYVVWQEVFDNHDKVKPDTIVEVWKKENWEGEVLNVTKAGLKTILSAPWYLNYINYGSDVMTYYLEDPQAFGGTPEQESLVVGGEACMWGEWVNSINLLPRLWPRASGVAERLWSARDVRDTNEASRRIQEHECRMLIRGYPVQPSIGPSFCKVDWNNM